MLGRKSPQTVPNGCSGMILQVLNLHGCEVDKVETLYVFLTYALVTQVLHCCSKTVYTTAGWNAVDGDRLPVLMWFGLVYMPFRSMYGEFTYIYPHTSHLPHVKVANW